MPLDAVSAVPAPRCPRTALAAPTTLPAAAHLALLPTATSSTSSPASAETKSGSPPLGVRTPAATSSAASRWRPGMMWRASVSRSRLLQEGGSREGGQQGWSEVESSRQKKGSCCKAAAQAGTLRGTAPARYQQLPEAVLPFPPGSQQAPCAEPQRICAPCKRLIGRRKHSHICPRVGQRLHAVHGMHQSECEWVLVKSIESKAGRQPHANAESSPQRWCTPTSSSWAAARAWARVASWGSCLMASKAVFWLPLLQAMTLHCA